MARGRDQQLTSFTDGPLRILTQLSCDELQHSVPCRPAGPARCAGNLAAFVVPTRLPRRVQQPASCVERFFAELTSKQLRHSAFRRTGDLEATAHR